MAGDPAEPLLLTPGPVSTSRSVKSAMMRDRASGGREFHSDQEHARTYMVGLVHSEGAYTAIPLPGSATYANEGVIAQLVPPGGKLLIHTSGVYGDRLIEIAAHLGAPHAVIRTAPFTPSTAGMYEQAVVTDPAITHVMIVHCETSTGMLNPLDCGDRGLPPPHQGAVHRRRCFVQCDRARCPHAGFPGGHGVVEQCMQSVPGIGWAVVQKTVLENARGHGASLVLDLWNQNQHMEYAGVPLHAADAGAGRVRPGWPGFRISVKSGHRRREHQKA